MFSASQARNTAAANKARNAASEIADAIRHKVTLGEFLCYFTPEQEQQVRAVLAGKGYNIERKSYMRDNWYDARFDDSVPKEVEVFYIEVTW